MSGKADKSGPGGTSRTRALATVAATALVVTAEFALLTAVYDRAEPIRRDQVAVASLSGTLESATGRELTAAARGADAVLTGLSSSGVPRADLSAARRLAADTAADPAGVEQLRSAVRRLAVDLDHRQRTVNAEARLSYAGLLVLASLGWMAWFRRLVSRHRALQREVTAQQARSDGEQRLAALVRNATDVVAVCEADATISFATPPSLVLLGIADDQLVGTRLTELVHPGDLDVFLQRLASPGLGVDEHILLRMIHADGRILSMEGTLSNLLGDPAVGGLVLTLRDITARRELEERLTFQAFHDGLTGMANRQLFTDRLQHALIRRSGPASPLVVLFCDLDDFKSVNDGAGHGVGDRVLAEVGARLKGVVRAGDTAARLGGDEFAILMDSATIESAHEVAQRVQAALAPPIVVGDRSMTVRASIGLAQAVPGEMDAEEALRNADVAMYLAKDRGQSGIVVYESRVHTEALERLALRADLQRALTRSELMLHYQPIIDLRTVAVKGFEALVRWQHPTRGLMSPALFIPMAEETGLILPLGAWVLRAACEAAADMQRPGCTPTMSVNVSAQQLSQPGFVDSVLAALTDTGLPSDRLTLEITETVILRDLDTVAPRLAALREVGVKVAIDDFGTGYSSLAYLSSLPVDVLKVDKSFIDKVTTDKQAASLAEAIIALSHKMHFTTVAEGVEQPEQAAWLRKARCTYGQGYLWSRPVDLAAARAMLGSEVGFGTPARLPRADRRAFRGAPTDEGMRKLG